MLAALDRALANPTMTPRLEWGLTRAAVVHKAWTALTTGMTVRHLRQIGFDVHYPALPTDWPIAPPGKGGEDGRFDGILWPPAPPVVIALVLAVFVLLVLAVSRGM